ncbi:MAG: hypothetical protein IPM68_17485 [Flavobacteriales bacterium]|nr:hypothetical protein [Flavobacteriales bacterium]
MRCSTACATTQRAKRAIEHEKERSDELLHNILPVEVAAELKATGRAEGRTYTSATVLFTDFKGFTQLSEQLSAAELVEEIDARFKGLDAIVERHRVEKIRTIGDAYMAAAGLPDPKASSAADIVLAALDMRDHIAQRRTERLRTGKPAFELRIGLHSGSVIAGIVGLRTSPVRAGTASTQWKVLSASPFRRMSMSQLVIVSPPVFWMRSTGVMPPSQVRSSPS